MVVTTSCSESDQRARTLMRRLCSGRRQSRRPELVRDRAAACSSPSTHAWPCSSSVHVDEELVDPRVAARHSNASIPEAGRPPPRRAGRVFKQRGEVAGKTPGVANREIDPSEDERSFRFRRGGGWRRSASPIHFRIPAGPLAMHQGRSMNDFVGVRRVRSPVSYPFSRVVDTGCGRFRRRLLRPVVPLWWR